jgi:hypothetical protein
LISHKKWSPGPETAVSRAIQGNRSYHGLTDQFNVSNGSISSEMKLFIPSDGVIHRCTKQKLQIATPKQDKFLLWLSKKARSFRPGRAQNGSTDEKHGFSQCYHRLKKVTGCEKILDAGEEPDRPFSVPLKISAYRHPKTEPKYFRAMTRCKICLDQMRFDRKEVQKVKE